MKKIISQCSNYRIDNPFMKKEPFRNRLMTSAFNIYKSTRTKISKLDPLKSWQENLWREPNLPFLKTSNSAKDNGGNSYFNLEFMFLLEIIPKEKIDYLVKGINRFVQKHSTGYTLNRSADSAYFKYFNDSDNFSTLRSIAIKKKSILYSHFSSINFKLISISSSFCCLSLMIGISEKLKRDISNFVTSNVEFEKSICGFDEKKWYQFRGLSYVHRPGTMIKRESLEDIINDLKWRLSHELGNYIHVMLFHSQRIIPPSILSFQTNIDGNSNNEFWKSISVYPTESDFTEDYKGCIAWDFEVNNIKYIFSKGEDLNFQAELLASDIDLYLCKYLVAREIDAEMRKYLARFSDKIIVASTKSLKYWLKLKIQLDSKMFYIFRFINEFHITDYEFDDFTSLRKNKVIIINNECKSINKTITDAKKIYEDISSIINSNTDFINLKDTSKMQRQTVYITFVSVIIAVIALFVTITTNSKAITDLWNFIISIYNWYRDCTLWLYGYFI